MALLIEAVLANLNLEPERETTLRDGTPIDWLDLTWRQCQARAGQWTTRNGQPVRVLLPLGVTLQHGDVLHQSAGKSAIVVAVQSIATLCIEHADPTTLATAAYILGDLHHPAAIRDSTIITPTDPAVAAILTRKQLPFTRRNQRFQPNLKPAGVQLSPAFEIRKTSAPK